MDATKDTDRTDRGSIRIVHVNVGERRTVAMNARAVATSIYKEPIVGPHWVGVEGLLGDGRVAPRRMGLAEHAVYAYPLENYAYWQGVLGCGPFPPGQFGENLTIAGLSEFSVRLGDILQLGTTLLQVAHPRIPCAKLDHRMGVPFGRRFLESGRVGYYLRVLREGEVRAGDEVRIRARDPASPTIADFVRIAFFEQWDKEGLRQLLAARDLCAEWRETLTTLLRRAEEAHGWSGWRALEVVARTSEAPGVLSLRLRCARGRALPRMRGGHYLTLAHDQPAPAPQLKRWYPLSGDPSDEDSYRIAVGQPSAGEGTDAGSAMGFWLQREIQVGDVVRAMAPRGSLLLDDLPPGATMVLLSDGIAIALMLGLLYELAAQERAGAVVFLHQRQSPGGIPFLQELAALAARHRWLTVGCAAVDWAAEVLPAGIRPLPGPLDGATVAALAADREATLFLGGSADFVDRMRVELKEAGFAEDSVRVDAMTS